jgi:hypothetical protein
MKNKHLKIAVAAALTFASLPALVLATPLIGTDLASYSILAGGYLSYGAGTTVNGNVGAVTYIDPVYAMGTNSSVDLIKSPNVIQGLAELSNAKSALNNMGTGTALLTTLGGNNTFFSGVYSAADLTTAAGSIITLDGRGELNPYWVFNITNYLATGAGTKINIINTGANGGVFWNTGGYASLGASTELLGTVLSTGYISIGAESKLLCGSSYSSSYVSVGAGVNTGSSACNGTGTWVGSTNSLSGGLDIVDGIAVSSLITAVPETETLDMVLTGICLIGLIIRRRKNKQA